MNWRWKIAQAAEIRWWQRYLHQKDEKDYLRWKQAYWRQMLSRLEVQLQPAERVLDAGCGPAGIFSILNNQRVTALDPLLDTYATKLPHFNPGAWPNVQFVNQPIETFAIDEPFDHVFCLNAINHVADLNVAMDALVSCCKAGGQLILSIDVHNFQLLKSLFRLFPGDVLHPHQHDLDDYKKMLALRHCSIHQEVLFKKAFIFNYYVLVANV